VRGGLFYVTRNLCGISLFCGAGGLDVGVESTDRMQVRLGVDLNADVGPTWRANAKLGSRPDSFLCGDVRDLRATDLPPGADFILGSTPCQAFSHANPDGDPDDPDIGYVLVRAFLDLVRAYRPRWWLMENVPGLLPIIRRRDSWIPRLAILNSADYGTPQVRRRLFAGDYPLPTPTHSPIAGQTTLDGRTLGKWVSVREALGLAVSRRSHSGGTRTGTADGRPSFSVGTQSGSGTSRTAMFTVEPKSDRNVLYTLEEADRISRRKPRSVDRPARTVVAGGKRGGKTVPLLISGFAHGWNQRGGTHSPTYAPGRPARVVGVVPDGIVNAAAPDWTLDPDYPAPTIFFGGNPTDGTPQGGGPHPWSLWEDRPAMTVISAGRLLKPGHHDSLWLAVRRLTPMECATLQGFPKDFRWLDPRPRRDGTPRRTLLYSMIGNAVPPQFGRTIGEAILREVDRDGYEIGSEVARAWTKR